MPDARTVLFDLDGTLVDTAPDMAAALNDLLREQGRAPLAYSRVRPHVSHGATALTRLGFEMDPDHPQFDQLRGRFLQHYQRRLCRETRVFDGIEDVLSYCETHGIRWGVVTNKPGYLTEPLLAQLDLVHRAACVVSGDTLTNRKPHPDPLLHGCRLASGSPERCIYVGDAARDVEAGRRAGMTTLVALFGYLGEADRPETWGADGLVRVPQDIIGWLQNDGGQRVDHAR